MNSFITKGPERTNTARASAFWYSSAREGFLDLLHHGNLESGVPQGILLPAYIGWSSNEGSGVFDPVRESGRPFDFYGLDSNLSVDLSSLQTLLNTGRFSHVVLIHYFGRRDPRSSQVYQVAHAHGASVIDDLAHGFFSSFRSGGAFGGDAQLYSLHKQFPLPDGGMVRYNRDALVSQQRSTRPELAEAVFNFDWEQLSRLRRRNHALLVERLSMAAEHGRYYELMWSELDQNDVPQSFPVRLAGDGRDELYFALNDAGFGATSLYHTLIPESAGRFHEMDLLSRRIINLPLHQDADASEVQRMADTFTSMAARLVTP